MWASQVNTAPLVDYGGLDVVIIRCYIASITIPTIGEIMNLDRLNPNHTNINPRFHLGTTFLQLIIFGMLAATTRGTIFPLSTFILR